MLEKIFLVERAVNARTAAQSLREKEKESGKLLENKIMLRPC